MTSQNDDFVSPLSAETELAVAALIGTLRSAMSRKEMRLGLS